MSDRELMIISTLDGISMRLVAIGEGFKNIDKLTDMKLLPNYPKVNWKGVKGVRDILSHHYFDLDAETIFVICDSYLEELLIATNKMIDDVKIGIENERFFKILQIKR